MIESNGSKIVSNSKESKNFGMLNIIVSEYFAASIFKTPKITSLNTNKAKKNFPAHWDPKLRIPRGQVVAAASIVSPKY